MISKDQRIILKQLLKGSYINDVKIKLNEKNVKTQKGKEYSDKMISHVFNGRYDNPAIETAIFEVYEERKKHIDNWEREKNRLLGLDP